MIGRHSEPTLSDLLYKNTKPIFSSLLWIIPCDLYNFTYTTWIVYSETLKQAIKESQV